TVVADGACEPTCLLRTRCGRTSRICRAFATPATTGSLSRARHLTYRDVEQRLPSLQADSDVVSFGASRVLCFDPGVHDHHRQPSLFAVQVPDPVIQREKLRCIDPPGDLIGQPQPRAAQVLHEPAGRLRRLPDVAGDARLTRV